jgi:hypothetical protein
MTLKTRPEFMKPLLSLLVIDKRNESGEGVRKSGRLEFCLERGQHFKAVPII